MSVHCRQIQISFAKEKLPFSRLDFGYEEFFPDNYNLAH